MSQGATERALDLSCCDIAGASVAHPLGRSLRPSLFGMQQRLDPPEDRESLGRQRRRALRRRGIRGWYGTLATLPLYWLLMSAAAWLALWQFAAKPFHWNKTEHGLSHVAPVRRRLRGTG